MQPRLHFGAGQGIERTEGLIQEQDVSALDHRAQQGGPLPHPSGELEGMGVLKTGEAEGGEQTLRPGAGVLFARTAHLEAESGVFENAAPGKQQVFLWHVCEVLTLARDGRTIDKNVARAGGFESSHDVEHGALPASARADDRHEFSWLRGEGDVVDDGARVSPTKVERFSDAP